MRSDMYKTMATKSGLIISTMHVCMFVTTIYCIASSGACPTLERQSAEGDRRVDNQYVVYVENEHNNASTIVNTVAGIQILQVVKVGSSAQILIEGLPEAVRELSKRPEILAVDFNRVYGLSGTPPPAHVELQNGHSRWGQKRIVSRSRPQNFRHSDADWNNDAGTGSTIFVVDSGIYADHQEFQGKMISSYTALRLAEAEGDGDLCGHSTYDIALIVGGTYGVARGTTIVSLKGCDSNCECTEFDVTEVLTWAYKNRGSGSNIILMTLKSENISYGFCNLLKLLTDDDFLLVIAMESYINHPCVAVLSTSDHVILVGATDMEDKVASLSLSGKVVDVFAPGVKIESAWIGSRDAKMILSGNSPAAALVAGSLAGYLSQFSGSQPPVTMRKWLRDSTLPVDTVSPRQRQDVIPFLYVPYLLTGGKQDDGNICQPLEDQKCKESYFMYTVIGLFFLGLTVLGIYFLGYWRQ